MLFRRTFMLFVVVFLVSCGKENTAAPELIRPIAWTKVKSHQLEQVRRISGIVHPAEETQLSFEVGGKISAVKVKLGDRVKRGDLLAQIDTENYDLNLRSARAELSRARSVFVEAQNTFERQANIFEKGFVSKADYDDAKASLDSAQSAVDAAEASAELAEKNLSDTKLFAPYDGVIISRKIEPSQQVVAGQACFEIEGDKGLEISVLVPESLLSNLEKDHVYAASFPAIGGITLDTHIVEIGSQAEAANAFQVTLSIDANNEALRAGMSAEVDFDFEGRGISSGYRGLVIYVPPSAIIAGESDKHYVFVYKPETGTVHRRVVLPDNMIGNTVQVTQGLSEGEIVATAGVEYLYDGQEVTLLNTGPDIFN